MRSYLLFTLCILLATTSLSTASENPYRQFNADVEQAYSAYRKALFQTNKKDIDKSNQANKSFMSQWKQIRQKYGNTPPEVFASDVKWASTLSTIDEIAVKSADQIQAGQLAEAHETLEAIRDELSDLRRRNSIIVFSDHINNYHEVMEGLLVKGYTPEKIKTEGIDEINGKLAVLQYLAEAIHNNAPEKLKQNLQYQELESNLINSLNSLQKAIDSKNSATISKSLKMLKPAYAKLFVNFG